MEISPYYEKKVECINCKSKFETTKVRSRFVRVASHESDLKPVYTNPDINPMLYNVAVCPKCGFSFTDDFAPYFAPGTKDLIQEKITSQWSEHSFGGERTIDESIETFKLAYLSGMLKKEKALSLAGITLRIAWLYRDKADIDNEYRFLKTARDFYVQSYSVGDYSGTQMSESRVLYVIAELSWKIGDKEEAVRHFSRVIEGQRNSTDPKIVEMAKDRWQEIRENE